MCERIGEQQQSDPLASISRQRIDYLRGPDGSCRAVLTITLAGVDRPFRFEAAATEDDLPAADPVPFIGATSTDKLPARLASHRVLFSWQAMKNWKPSQRPKGWQYNAPRKTIDKWWSGLSAKQRGSFKVAYAVIRDRAPKTLKTDDARNLWWHSMSKARRDRFRNLYDNGLLDDIADAAGDAVNAVKKVAASKAFRTAAKGLATVAPALGPFAPAATAVASGMGVASTIAAKAVAAERGAKKAAKALGALAVKEAKKVAPRTANTLLAIAHKKAKSALAVAAKPKAKPKPKPKPKPKAKPKPKPAAPPAPKPKASPLSSAALLAAAKAGRIASNQPGKVTQSALLAAHKGGRVFFVAA